MDINPRYKERGDNPELRENRECQPGRDSNRNREVMAEAGSACVPPPEADKIGPDRVDGPRRPSENRFVIFAINPDTPPRRVGVNPRSVSPRTRNPAHQL